MYVVAQGLSKRLVAKPGRGNAFQGIWFPAKQGVSGDTHGVWGKVNRREQSERVNAKALTRPEGQLWEQDFNVFERDGRWHQSTKFRITSRRWNSIACGNS